MIARFDEIPSMTLLDIKETVYTKAIKNYKKDNKQCLLDTPTQGTSHKRLISKHKISVKNMHIYTKAMALLRITTGNFSNSIGPKLLGFY